MKSAWPEWDAALIERWNRGESAATIARALGLFRDQVHDRVHALRRRGVPLATRDRGGARGVQPNAWPAERCARLRQLWAEGLPASQIAERLGTTKNAIVGRAHRLELPARPSPIRHGEGPRPARRAAPRPLGEQRRANGHHVVPKLTLPPLPPACDLSPIPAPRAGPITRPQPQPGAAPGRRTCQWVTAERPVAYCGQPAGEGCGDWCAKHHAIVYVRVRRREAIDVP